MSVLIIAEIGSVHDGSFAMAKKLIDLAKKCGADIVKFQTHIADAETTRDAPSPSYFTAESRYDYFTRTGFTQVQWKALKKHADKVGIEFLSSPFSIEAVRLLEKVGVKRYKVPSGEVTNIPLLQAIAKTRKPVLISSGMSSWKELDEAVKTIRRVHDKITVLQCTSEYPCPPEQVGLNLIMEMRKRYKLPVGFSDHTLTIDAPVAATALGITVLEKHLTLSRKMYGSDAKHSLEPEEFSDMVRAVRAVETMLASKVDMHDVRRVSHMKRIFEKSVVTVVDIPAGTRITAKMIAVKKPGTGIPAKDYEKVIGKRTKRKMKADRVITWKDIGK